MDTSGAGLMLSTTSQIDNRPVLEYRGIVCGEAVMSTVIAPGRVSAASRGSRSQSVAVMLEQRVCETRCAAIACMARGAAELGAKAVIAINITYTPVYRPDNDELLIITASGTVVVL